MPGDTDENQAATVTEVHQATLALVTAVHGSDAPQLATLRDALVNTKRWGGDVASGLRLGLWPIVVGTLRSLKGDIEGGVVGDLERHIAGELLADMLGIAREALRENTDGAKNVASVLVAATYEDTIRKMGSTLAGIHDRRELSQVFAALKAAGVMVGAPLTLGLSFLKFRNDALHADWQHIDAPTVSSCLAFVEGLIVKYFS